jgi:hypothetical protein
MFDGELVGGSHIERNRAVRQHFFQLRGGNRSQFGQIVQRRSAGAIDRRIFQEVVRTRRQVLRLLPDVFVAVLDLQRLVRQPLGADRRRPFGAHVAAAQ